VLSQEDKPKRHRSAREILHETDILRSSVHRIIHRDLQLKYSKQRRAQLLSELLKPIASPVSRADKQPYPLIICNKSCYCSIVKRKLKSK